MKKFFGFMTRIFKKQRPGYEYPVDERQYEENPIKLRTSEVSQFQDEARDIETRTPEREVFDEMTSERTLEGLHHQDDTANQTGANPGRSSQPLPR